MDKRKRFLNISQLCFKMFQISCIKMLQLGKLHTIQGHSQDKTLNAFQEDKNWGATKLFSNIIICLSHNNRPSFESIKLLPLTHSSARLEHFSCPARISQQSKGEGFYNKKPVYKARELTEIWNLCKPSPIEEWNALKLCQGHYPMGKGLNSRLLSFS